VAEKEQNNNDDRCNPKFVVCAGTSSSSSSSYGTHAEQMNAVKTALAVPQTSLHPACPGEFVDFGAR